ncbi:MAG: ATP-binding protein [Opitutaceae bacterium]|nr:ATP-binding protein [Opitutaceae bacterium]
MSNPDPGVKGATPPEHYGYRLLRFEFTNWGTFNRGQQVEVLKVGGRNALITGSNGAGKSTLVDGLQALLVPPANRTYNKAGGAKRHERSDRSYIEGWFGQGLESAEAPRRLRVKGEKTLLLAVFGNAVTGDTVSLGGIFWMDDGEPQRLYLARRGEASIATDFANLPAGRDLKKKLRERDFEPSSEHSEFATRFRALLRIPHEAALKLLAQAVSMKDPQDINTFVRRHMLEPHDMRPAIDNLRQHFDDLVKCREKIEEAEKRRALLEPIEAAAMQLESLRQDSASAAEAAKAVRPFVAQVLIRWARAESEQVATALNGARAAQKEEEENVGRLRQHERSLDLALQANSAHGHLQRLEREIGDLEKTRQERRQSFEFVQRTLEQAGEHFTLGTTATFDAGMARWRSRLTTLAGEIEDLRNRKAEQEAAIRTLREQNTRDQADLELIKQQASNIPADLLRLRRELAGAADLTEDRLPFAGELIEVKTEEAAWRGAIERLMRPFALSLLVPDVETIYPKVVAYIRRSHLNQRLVFYKVHLLTGVRFDLGSAEARRVWGKLRLKDDHPMQTWLARELRNLYDHVCCDAQEEFERTPRALTKEGLVSHSEQRREKNDRSRIGEVREYVLGWSNRDKVAALAKAIGQRTTEIERLEKAAVSAKDTVAKRQPIERALDIVVTTATFEKIDYETSAQRIVELKKQQKKLLEEDKAYAALKVQHEKAKADLAVAETEEKKKAAAVTRLSVRAEALASLQRQKSELVTDEGVELAARHASTLQHLLGGVEINADTFDTELARIDVAARGAATRKANAVAGCETQIVGLMGEYQRQAYDPGLTVALAALPDFRERLTRLVKDDLPTHKRRFNELMEKKVVYDAGKFASELGDQARLIEERLAELNAALREVPYTAESYVQLRHTATTNVDIVEFKRRLRAATQHAANWTEAQRVEAFDRIRALLADFDARPEWRAHVTDTRNWWEFSAIELAQADDAELRPYWDSAGLSAGQKAKLAYTFLVAGLVLQYGLSREKPESRTFRFVMVDEVFKGVDKDNALYAMRLFRNFGLQLLLVNPWNDEIKMIEREDFVASYHLITNRDQCDSRLCSISRADLLDRLEKLRAESADADAS